MEAVLPAPNRSQTCSRATPETAATWALQKKRQSRFRSRGRLSSGSILTMQNSRYSGRCRSRNYFSIAWIKQLKRFRRKWGAIKPVFAWSPPKRSTLNSRKNRRGFEWGLIFLTHMRFLLPNTAVPRFRLRLTLLCQESVLSGELTLQEEHPLSPSAEISISSSSASAPSTPARPSKKRVAPFDPALTAALSITTTSVPQKQDPTWMAPPGRKITART